MGRAGDPLWCGPSLGALGFSHRATIRKARIGELCDIALAHNFLWKTSLRRRLAPPCVQSPAAAGRWKGHPVARAAVRPAAPVRLGRGSELLRLISPEYLASSQVRQAPARRSMYDLYGDPTDISGARDDARMEMKPTADPRDGDQQEGSPTLTSRTSANSASRTLDKADHEEVSGSAR